jgi:predicted hotdog family 3-hydroxylacyl-ACP dehydratase
MNVLGVRHLNKCLKRLPACKKLIKINSMRKTELEDSTKNDLKIETDPEELTTSESIVRVKQQQLKKKIESY